MQQQHKHQKNDDQHTYGAPQSRSPQIGQRHIHYAHQPFAAHLTADRISIELLQKLFTALRPNRTDHSTARLQLIEQFHWNRRRCGTHMDGIVWSMGGMTETTVTLCFWGFYGLVGYLDRCQSNTDQSLTNQNDSPRVQQVRIIFAYIVVGQLHQFRLMFDAHHNATAASNG